MSAPTKSKSQIDKFRETARALEANEDESKFNEALRSIATKRGQPADAPGQKEPPQRKGSKPR